MKNEAQHAKKVGALLKRIKQAHPANKIEETDPVTQMVYSFLEWNASRPMAVKAYQKITQIMVDNNDMRVSHAFEMVNIIGESYPQSAERCIRLHESLQEIFVREHIVALNSVQGKGKKQCLEYLESLPGIPGYVIRAVMLYGLGHAMLPVDDVAVMLMEQEEAIEPGARPEEVAAYLEKHIDAKDMLTYALHLRGWCDENTKLIKQLKKTEVLEAAPPVAFELISTEAPAKQAEKPADNKAGEKPGKDGKASAEKPGVDKHGKPKPADKPGKDKQPAAPTKAEKPAKAEKPGKPVKPGKPAKPAAPEKPAKPVKPSAKADAGKPGKPSKPAAKSASKAETKPAKPAPKPAAKPVKPAKSAAKAPPAKPQAKSSGKTPAKPAGKPAKGKPVPKKSSKK